MPRDKNRTESTETTAVAVTVRETEALRERRNRSALRGRRNDNGAQRDGWRVSARDERRSDAKRNGTARRGRTFDGAQRNCAAGRLRSTVRGTSHRSAPRRPVYRDRFSSTIGRHACERDKTMCSYFLQAAVHRGRHLSIAANFSGVGRCLAGVCREKNSWILASG